MKAKFALAAPLLAVLLVGCAGSSHTWKGEFTARLEGVTASMRQTLSTTGPTESKEHVFDAYANLGRELLFKGELIGKLEPPEGCASVQEKGYDHVRSDGIGDYGVEPKNYTPAMFGDSRKSLTREISKIDQIGQEAETCEAG